MQITTAAQSAQRDADAIASGIDSFTLMHAAGQAAAQFVAELATRFEAPVVSVLAGTGNNGGDAYVVAAELLHNGFTVVLYATGEPRTPDAVRARDLYLTAREAAGPAVDIMVAAEEVHFVLVDGLLGTGQQGELRDAVRAVANRIARFRAFGGVVVALDVPTGVNATTGEIVEGAVQADYTLAFGTMKRAHVLQREQCGEVLVLDIGLGDFAEQDDAAWTLADRVAVASVVPAIKWNAYKGTRGRLAIAGGNHGMSGAVTLASQSALRTGIGLVHALVHEASILPLQIAVPQALAHAWSDNASRKMLATMDAVAIGPGFGHAEQSRAEFEALLRDSPAVPLVLDADALTLIGTDTARLAALSATRAVVCTPHVGEFARLLGEPVASDFDTRVTQAQNFANRSGVTLLLKGTPTIIAFPPALVETTTASAANATEDATAGGRENATASAAAWETSSLTTSPLVVARGTPVLATGGSGDLLTGIIGTLLAQGMPAPAAAAAAAWVHGRAAEIATARAASVRGVTLQHVLDEMARAWSELRTRRANEYAHGLAHSHAHEHMHRHVQDHAHGGDAEHDNTFAQGAFPAEHSTSISGIVLAHLPAAWKEHS